MAVDFGSAIAQGVTKGLGEGFSQHLADQRRERQDALKLTRTFDMFKKQQDYKAGMQYIQGQNEVLGKWETAAQLDPQTLAYQVATKMSEPFAKEDRPQFFREAYKNLNGMSKAELLTRAGYVKPDYSAYVDKPEYQDAIPRSRIAGIADMPDMEATFQYDPQTFADVMKAKGEKLTDYQRERQDGLQLISNRVQSMTGFKLSPGVQADLYGDGSSIKTETKGAYNIDPAMTRFNALQNKVYFPVGGEVKMRSEMTNEDWDQWNLEQTGQTPQKPTETPAPAPIGAGAASYETPETAKYLEEKEQKEQTKEQRAAAKRVGDKHGKLIGSYGALEELTEATKNLSEGAKKYLYGDVSWKGLGAVSDKVTQLAAKTGDPDAQEAARYLSLVTNITARIKHDQYGSAQTATELADFASQLGRPGIFQNPKTFLDQLEARKASVGRDIRSSIGESDRQAYLAEHKEDPYVNAAFGIKEDTGKNGQVSDSANQEAKLRQEASAYVDNLISQGQFDESQRESIINHLVSQSLKPIE